MGLDHDGQHVCASAMALTPMPTAGLMSGFALDYAAYGRKYDGPYWACLAGLELLRTMNDLGIQDKAPVS